MQQRGDIPDDAPHAAPAPTTIHRVQVGSDTIELEGPAEPDALVREAVARGEREPEYWAHLWPSAHQLALFVQSSHFIVPDSGVLEIGCGLGLPGIIAARRGARVVMTDHSEAAAELCRRNVNRNGVSAIVQTFDWFQPPDSTWSIDTLIAADVLYDAVNHIPIARLIASLQCTAIICDPNRPAADGVGDVFGSHELRTWNTQTNGGRIFLVSPR